MTATPNTQTYPRNARDAMRKANEFPLGDPRRKAAMRDVYKGIQKDEDALFGEGRRKMDKAMDNLGQAINGLVGALEQRKPR